MVHLVRARWHHSPWGFFIHGPVLKLAATATNQPLSSLLTLFKVPQKEAGKWNKTLPTPAGFSGTEDLLFNHQR